MGAGPIEILRIGLIKTKVDDERVVDSATIAELAALLDTVLASIESGLDQEA